MNVALFLTGHVRDAPLTEENYQQFLQHHNLSVYVSTWNTYDLNRITHEPMLESVNVEEAFSNLFGDKLKGIWAGDIMSFLNEDTARRLWPADIIQKSENPRLRNDQQGLVWLQRVLDQWYGVKKAWQLCENPSQFDVCIRARCDMSFLNKPPIPIDDIRAGIHVNGYMSGYLHWRDWPNQDSTNLVPFKVSDQLAWGSPEWMVKYFEYYDNVIDIFYPLLLQPNEVFYYSSEHMLTYYLLRHPRFKSRAQIELGDNDLDLHIHGHESSWAGAQGNVKVISDFYDIRSRWIYG